ncbi:S49 family peptidase [Massilia sp. IC2-477]|uniref:S49 family peptidase n=1 Tax=unclassified Massilia TaxID=2609279 RepID=UPI001D123ED2|nr:MULTISPECIES: S49 family peptidase [unclassified Massilia]MCC2957075.1 S49 family peptidase [Massilia sp. IC2-477]MCC2970884.1 S49 family peptidase [Massilia sp. IC2-476]
MSEQASHDQPGEYPAEKRLAANPTASNWERETLEKLVFATVRERRAARRWGIFFKLSFLLVAVLALLTYYDSTFGFGGDENLGRHTALIEINGEIESEGSGAADTVIPSLNKAFSDAGSAAVVLRIDSPGGSPVQAGIIVDEIQRLKRGYPDKPLYVVVDEICASGGYYIASAADRIYVNKASIVGSVGVLMDSFGFTGTMEKLGVERRLLTAGENKGFLDPFSPQSDKHKAHAQAMLNEIHQQFISVVRAGRGKRLKETPETFSGLYWTGAKAVEMGLADGFGTVDTVARDIVKAEDIVDYTAHEGLPERVLKKFGASVGHGAVSAAFKGAVPQVR